MHLPYSAILPTVADRHGNGFLELWNAVAGSRGAEAVSKATLQEKPQDATVFVAAHLDQPTFYEYTPGNADWNVVAVQPLVAFAQEIYRAAACIHGTTTHEPCAQVKMTRNNACLPWGAKMPAHVPPTQTVKLVTIGDGAFVRNQPCLGGHADGRADVVARAEAVAELVWNSPFRLEDAQRDGRPGRRKP